MDRHHLVTLLAATFAGLALVLGVVALVAEPLVLMLAVPFGVVSYVMWYQASGRLASRIYRGVEERARVDSDVGGGRRTRRGRRSRRADGGDGTGARGDQRTRGRRRSSRVNGGRTRSDTGGAAGRPPEPNAISEREAYDRLGLEPGADEAAVRDAYRERVKEVHPDRGGDEEAFKRVNAAYDRLTE